MLQLIEYSQILIETWTRRGPLPRPLGKWILLGLMLIAFAAFLWAMWPKARVLMRSTGENRLDRPAKRMWNTLCIAFAQTKMFKDRTAGWIHALIFWGFLVLLFRAFEFFLMGFWPIDLRPIVVDFDLRFSNPLFALNVIPTIYSIYFYVKEVFVLLVIIACLYALFRRLVIKPKRLTLSGEGIVILLLILTIMVSDIVFEGAMVRPHNFMSGLWSPLGTAFAIFLPAWDYSTVASLKNGAYWTHIVSILIFLVMLPRSKHFHIITSIPNVFLGNVTQTGNQLSRIDFEDESKETFGVTRIEEFSWKKLLDLHTCTECGRW